MSVLPTCVYVHQKVPDPFEHMDVNYYVGAGKQAQDLWKSSKSALYSWATSSSAFSLKNKTKQKTTFLLILCARSVVCRHMPLRTRGSHRTTLRSQFLNHAGCGDGTEVIRPLIFLISSKTLNPVYVFPSDLEKKQTAIYVPTRGAIIFLPPCTDIIWSLH